MNGLYIAALIVLVGGVIGLIWGWSSSGRPNNPDDYGGVVGGIVALIVAVIVAAILAVVGWIVGG